MKKIISSVIRQPVTVLMLTLLLIFGGVVGTLVTLVLIPCIYCGINRLVADANGER